MLPKEFLPGDSAIMIPKTDDGRVLFAVPWHGRVVVGTTDTPLPHKSTEPHSAAGRARLSHGTRGALSEPRSQLAATCSASMRACGRS